MSRPRPRPRRPVSRSRGDAREVPGLAARRGALAHLDAVLVRGSMLGDGAAEADSDPRIRAEALGLADLVLRRLGQIDCALAAFVDRPPAGPGRQILRLMAGELLFAGTAPHAGVDMAVRLAQGAKGTARLSGLINAVGRRLAAQVQEQPQSDPLAPAAWQDPMLAMPVWLKKRLTKDWGADVTAAIAAAHLVRPAQDLTMKVPADAPALAQDLGGTVLQTGSVRLPARLALAEVPGFEQGAWWVQDAAATLPAMALRGDGPVLDLCAAPGGKTMQLAAIGRDVTAVDLSDERLRRVRENLDRTGLDAEIVAADLLQWSPPAPVQAILLDAPCSATGTLRRHPDLGHRIDGSKITELVDLQTRLIEQAYQWLAPGGVMVWCTCSLLRAEGEDLAARLVQTLDGAEPMPITPEDGIPLSFIDARGCLRTRPDHWADLGGLDGFFAMRLRRT